MLAELANPLKDPWRYQWHPEVWLLIGFLIGAYVYCLKVLGPRVVREGPIATRRQVLSFAAAMALMWFASDWPMHDLAEEYLYSVHMVQHMILSYFVPPLALLATPEWLARLLIGDGRAYRVLRRLSRPVVAGVIFNAVVIITHIPGTVNASTEIAVLHYSLHVGLVITALLMWMCVVGPFPELRISPLGKCIYLFLMSVIPTVPAAWLVFADGAVYRHYDQPIRVWGISVTDDQQMAGAIMKVGGAIYLWTIIVVIWFRGFAKPFNREQSYRRRDQVPTAEITGHDDFPLTTAEVDEAFRRTTPVPEPERLP